MSSSLSNESANESQNRSVTYKRATISQKEIFIRIVEEEGNTLAEAADIAGISRSTARSIMRRYRRDGQVIMQRPCGGRRPKKLTDEVLRDIDALIERNSGITLKAIQRRLQQKNIQLSLSSIHNALLELKITLKIGRVQVDRMNAPQTIDSRRSYARDFLNSINNESCIFVDESGFNLHLRRTKTKSRRNTRANIPVPTIRGRNVSLVAAMNHTGILHYKVYAGATVNSERFCIFLRELFEKLDENESMRNVLVIMDNAAIHKTREVRNAFSESYYSQKLLPPYSPMLNPIENTFSKVKNYCRQRLNSQDIEARLVDIINDSLDVITQSDCRNFILHMTSNLNIAAAGRPFT